LTLLTPPLFENDQDFLLSRINKSEESAATALTSEEVFG